MSLDVGALYEQHEPEIRRFVCDRLRGHAAPDSEDVAAMVWERAVRGVGAAVDFGRSRNWLFAIARNAVTDYYRSSRWRLANGTLPADALLEEHHPTRVDRYPSEYADLRAALDDLTPLQRRVIVLRHWYGYSFADLAPLVNTSEDGAKKLVKRALVRMRRYLEAAA